MGGAMANGLYLVCHHALGYNGLDSVECGPFLLTNGTIYYDLPVLPEHLLLAVDC